MRLPIRLNACRALLGLLVLVAAVTTPLQGAEAPTILVLGDSLSAAYGMATEDGWVSLLERRLRERDYPHRVVNASISGDTSGGGRARLPAALDAHRPAIVVLELGGNDGLLGLPIAELKANLDSLVAMSLQAGAKVLVLGIQIPPNYGPVYAEQFAAVFSSVAERHRLPLVPFLLDGVALNPELMQSDGIHPRAEAQPKLLETIWPVLEPLLQDQTAANLREQPRTSALD